MSAHERAEKQIDSSNHPSDTYPKSTEERIGHMDTAAGDDELTEHGDLGARSTESNVPAVSFSGEGRDSSECPFQNPSSKSEIPPPSFLRLPVELRTEVYGWLCVATPITLPLQDFARLTAFIKATADEQHSPLHATFTSRQTRQPPLPSDLRIGNSALLHLNYQIRIEYARFVQKQATVLLNIDRTNYARTHLWEGYLEILHHIRKCRIGINMRDIGESMRGRSQVDENLKRQKVENTRLVIGQLKECFTAMAELREITITWLRDWGGGANDYDEQGASELYGWSLYKVLKIMQHMKSIRIVSCTKGMRYQNRQDGIQEWWFAKKRSAKHEKEMWVLEYVPIYRWGNAIEELMGTV